MKDLHELAMELVDKQGDITIKDLKEILNKYNDEDTILVNTLRGTDIIDLKILHPTMISQICSKLDIIEGECGDGEGMCSKKCEIYKSCKGHMKSI